MNISSVKVNITEKDLLSIIQEILKEYVDVDGLSIDNILIEDSIKVVGKYKQGITIPFEATVSLEGVEKNVIIIQIGKIKVARIGIFNGIKNFALKMALKSLKAIGITVEKNILYINMDKLSKIIPFVNFKITELSIASHSIWAEVENINYTQDKKVKTLEELLEDGSIDEELTDDEKTNNGDGDEENKDKPNVFLLTEGQDKKTSDYYTDVRENIQDKVPEKYKKISEYALILPDIVALLVRLFKDKRVNFKTKITVAGVLAYLVSPFDFLPDSIPFVGKIDDIALTFFALDKIINDIPEKIVIENWQGEDNIIHIIKEAVEYLSKIVGGKNISKIFEFINNNFVKSKMYKEYKEFKEFKKYKKNKKEKTDGK